MTTSELMDAVLFTGIGEPLRLERVPVPKPGPSEILVRVLACGVCRTDLHVLDGDLEESMLPLILGHQIVGQVEELGTSDSDLSPGDLVGIPWLGSTCGHCSYCGSGQENLCREGRFTGYQMDGGFAEFAVANHRFCFPIPQGYPALQAAPLLCAGLIGYRTLRLAGPGRKIGIYGFGAAAHIVAQVAAHQGRRMFAFSRPGDVEAQDFARSLGAEWAGGSDESPPEDLDAALIFAPVGSLIPKALRDVGPGGVVVSGGIHMSDIPSFPYRDLWEERVIRSVANLTRKDGEEFLALAPEIPIRTEVTTYPLDQAGQALEDLRNGRFQGAAVVHVSS